MSIFGSFFKSEQDTDDTQFIGVTDVGDFFLIQDYLDNRLAVNIFWNKENNNIDFVIKNIVLMPSYKNKDNLLDLNFPDSNYAILYKVGDDLKSFPEYKMLIEIKDLVNTIFTECNKDSLELNKILSEIDTILDMLSASENLDSYKETITQYRDYINKTLVNNAEVNNLCINLIKEVYLMYKLTKLDNKINVDSEFANNMKYNEQKKIFKEELQKYNDFKLSYQELSSKFNGMANTLL